MLKSPKVLLIITGSIAAYKACYLISKLVQNAYQVKVVATKASLEFIGKSTLEGLSGNPVYGDLFESGNAMAHINLVREADLIIVCPATAHYINRISQGIGDDLASSLFLAHDFKKPFLVAPAMNTKMYEHPVTQASINRLKSYGVEVLTTASGVLACGENGWGKLLDPDLIYAEIQKALTASLPSLSFEPTLKKSLPTKILITLGGTLTPVDSMRVLGNLSTGRTGLELTECLMQLGFDCHLLAAANTKGFMPLRFSHQYFVTFNDLENLLKDNLSQASDYRAVIHLAAVSDFYVSSLRQKSQDGDWKGLDLTQSFKISSSQDLQLELKPNKKLLPLIKDFSANKNLKVFGFKYTDTEDLSVREKKSLEVLKHGNVDYVVHNDRSDMNSLKHEFTFFSKNRDSFLAERIKSTADLASKIAGVLFTDGD